MPETPAGQQAGGLLDALASGNRDRIKSYIENNFASVFLSEIPLDEHVNANLRFAEQTGGVVPREIVSSSETRLRLLAESQRQGQL